MVTLDTLTTVGVRSPSTRVVEPPLLFPEKAATPTPPATPPTRAQTRHRATIFPPKDFFFLGSLCPGSSTTWPVVSMGCSHGSWGLL